MICLSVVVSTMHTAPLHAVYTRAVCWLPSLSPPTCIHAAAPGPLVAGPGPLVAAAGLPVTTSRPAFRLVDKADLFKP